MVDPMVSATSDYILVSVKVHEDYAWVPFEIDRPR